MRYDRIKNLEQIFYSKSFLSNWISSIIIWLILTYQTVFILLIIAFWLINAEKLFSQFPNNFSECCTSVVSWSLTECIWHLLLLNNIKYTEILITTKLNQLRKKIKKHSVINQNSTLNMNKYLIQIFTNFKALRLETIS